MSGLDCDVKSEPQTVSWLPQQLWRTPTESSHSPGDGDNTFEVTITHWKPGIHRTLNPLDCNPVSHGHTTVVHHILSPTDITILVCVVES